MSWFLKVKSSKHAQPWIFVIKSHQFHENIANRTPPSPLLRCAALIWSRFSKCDCVLTMLIWGIRVMRPKYLHSRRPLMWVSFYRKHTIYSMHESLGIDMMSKWNKLTFLRVSWRQLCRLLTRSQHKEVWSLLVPYGDSNVWPGGLLQATVLTISCRVDGPKASQHLIITYEIDFCIVHCPG